MSKEFLHQELEVAQAGGNIKEGTRGSRVAKFFTTSFFSFSISVAVGAVAFAVSFIICEVVGSSMMLAYNVNWTPSLLVYDPVLRETVDTNPRDTVLVNQFMKPRNGNVIVVRHYWGPDTYQGRAGRPPGLFIKRVVGVAGDRIRVERECTICNAVECGNHDWRNIVNNTSTPFIYRLVRNDEVVNENYRGFDQSGHGIMAFYGDNIYEYLERGKELGINARPHFSNHVPFHEKSVRLNEDQNSPSFGKWEIHVQKGEIFYLGDNRGSDDIQTLTTFLHSYDGSAFGPQPVNLVRGVVIDHMTHDQTIPEFVWSRIVYFFTFRWLF